ncbi:hypothetical protein SASPL_135419 [Salvia splendens]|uniref:Uncharacterized protein n=1 Tax=Salvia splendens TaxID=180675 RepID=A0A8X8ZFR7_SALSN|nr:hypothetical protein SASPL_135419 [Salvia splendens]
MSSRGSRLQCRWSVSSRRQPSPPCQITAVARRSRYDKVSYPIRRSWSEGSFSLIGQSSLSPSSSPASASAEIPRTALQLALCRAAEDDERTVSDPSFTPRRRH